MQRIAQGRPIPDRGSRSVSRKRRPSVIHTSGTPCAPDVVTVAPGFAQALPLLGGVQTSYSHELRAELLYELCAALVREGWGTPEIWINCDESAILFAQRAIMEAVGEERSNLLQRNVEYHLSVSDLAEKDGADTALGNGRLAVTIECGGSGFLKIGPAIEILEQEATGLGAAFYWTLTYAIYRVMRIYNHDDAFEYEQRMEEYAEEEDNPEQYEFPGVEKALPECLRNTLKGNSRRYAVQARKLLSRHRNGRYGGWIERLRNIERLSRVRLPSDGAFREDGGYDTIPLPSLLVAFEEHDAIVACFDEESQYMLEGSAEPALGVVFSPGKPNEVRRAVRTVSRFVGFNCELFQLVEAIMEWDQCHADSHLNRRESSLRAA
jgi:hypothetical protein